MALLRKTTVVQEQSSVARPLLIGGRGGYTDSPPSSSWPAPPSVAQHPAPPSTTGEACGHAARHLGKDSGAMLRAQGQPTAALDLLCNG